jgi:hypothetical protein
MENPEQDESARRTDPKGVLTWVRALPGVGVATLALAMILAAVELSRSHVLLADEGCDRG